MFYDFHTQILTVNSGPSEIKRKMWWKGDFKIYFNVLKIYFKVLQSAILDRNSENYGKFAA